MEKYMTLDSVFRVCLIVGMIFVFFGVAALDATGLSGSYSIGGTGASYPSLTDAINAAQTNGLAGNTSFILNAGSYSGAYQINLPGNPYTLMIRAAQDAVVTLDNPASNSSQNYIFRIDSTPNVYLQDLRFSTAGNYSRSVEVYGDSDGISIVNCRFTNAEGNYAGGSEAIVFTANGANDADNVTIALNSFYYGYIHISASSYSTATDYSGWDIFSNYHGHAYYGVSLQRASNLSIYGQIMEDVNTALNLSGCSGSVEIARNNISAWQSGIVLDGCALETNPGTGIVNNVVRMSGTYWYNHSYFTDAVGIYIGNCSNVLAYHNSVRNSSRTTGSYGLGVSGSANYIRKNILVSDGQGYAIYVGSFSGNTVEYNNLWTSHTDIARVGNNLIRDLPSFNALAGTQNLGFYTYFTDSLLRTVAPRLDNYGPAFGIGNDFNNFPRSASNPDIGAHEFASDPAMTPLSGNISVGAGQIYPSFASLIHALGFRGVEASLTVQLTDSLYVEQIEGFGIPGSSALNWVRILGHPTHGSTLRWDGQTADAPYTLKLNRFSYTNLQDIRFQTASTQNANLVWMPGYNHQIRFLDCQFKAPLGASGTSILSGYQDANSWLSVLSCGFYNNSYGIQHTGDQLTIGSCWFSNQGYGISITSSNGCDIGGNSFDGYTSSAIQTNGVQRLTLGYNQAKGAGAGFVLYNLSLDGTERNLIYNNTIHVTGGNQTNGITLGGNGINLLNNSVLCESTNSAALYMYSSPTQMDMMNNIFQARSALAVEFVYYTSAPALDMDFNCYHSQGNYSVRLGSGYFHNIQGLMAADPANNIHSIFLDPHFTADMHTQSPWLHGIGTPRGEFVDDMDRELRGSQWDIGADQQSVPIGFTPLSGTYTVGLGGEYPDMQQFLTDLHLLGTSGNVTANLLPGIHTGYHVLADFPRVIPASTLAFTAQPGASFQLVPQNTYNYENYIFKLQGADYVSFTGINFSVAASSRQSILILLQGKCDDITFQNCAFNMGSQSSTAIQATQSVNDGLDVYYCDFIGGTQALALSGADTYTNLYQNVRVEHCAFQTTANPFSLSGMNHLKLISNDVSAFTTTPSISSVYGNTDILRNKFRSHNFVGSYSSITLLGLSSLAGTADQPIEIVANLIYSKGNQTQSVTGLNISSSSHIRLLHNSIMVENQYSFHYGSALALSSVTNLWAANNAFSSPATGYALSIDQCASLSFANNAYFSGHPWLGRVNGTSYEAVEMISTQLQDAGGVYADPLPDASGYSTCQYLGGKGLPTYIDLDADQLLYSDPPNIGATYIAAAAALSGTISVGSGGDFGSLAAALDAVMSRGIAGNTQIILPAGTHNLNKRLGYVPNTLEHTLTISGAPNAWISGTASGANSNYALALRNVRNTVLDGLNFAPQTPAYSRAVTIESFGSDISIQNCRFSMDANSINSDASAGIYSSDAIIRALAVENCQIENHSRGIYVSANTSYPELSGDVSLLSNTSSGNYIGITLQYTTAPVVNANLVSGWRYAGIICANNRGAAMIRRNNVSGTGNYAMLMNNHTALSARPSVATNYFRCAPSSWGYALQMESCPDVDVYFNTFRVESASSSAYGFYQTGNCSGLYYANNLARGASSYAAVFSTPSWLLRKDHNLFYSQTGPAVRYGSTDIATLSAWTAASGDASSIFADPLLSAESYSFPPASPARNAGTVIDGLQYDILANWRDNPDIGCWEYTGGTLAAPNGLAISIDPATQEILLDWNAVSGAAFYTVYYADTPNPSNWLSFTVSATNARVSGGSGQKFFKVTASN